MTSNRDWLNALAHEAPDELAAWMGAEHVEAPTLRDLYGILGDEITPETPISAENPQKTGKQGQEGDGFAVSCKNLGSNLGSGSEVGSEVDSREKLESDVMKCFDPPEQQMLIRWLDRQAAIDRKEFQAILEEIQECVRNGNR